MKRNLLKMLLITASVALSGCLNNEELRNDNTPFTGEWGLTNIFTADFHYAKADSLVHDTLLFADIPAGVCSWNLRLDGTGEIVNTDYRFGDGEGEAFVEATIPINYNWQNISGYTYLFVSQKEYYSSYVVGKLTTDSLTLYALHPIEIVDGVEHQTQMRWTYTK